MINWRSFDKQPTADTLNDYPTILDILKDVVGQEEEEQIHKLPLNREKSDYFYDWSRTGHYLLMQDSLRKIPVLLPTSRTAFTFYRGQSEYHTKCLPSLYRYEGEKLEEETLRSYMQTAEMILLMKSHPVIRWIESVMYDGLAQHYGIKTCYLDLTNDIWCAAFFAATTYDGAYHPVVVTKDMSFKKQYGVLYMLDYRVNSENPDFSKDNILPIGLQYFNRPGGGAAAGDRAATPGALPRRRHQGPAGGGGGRRRPLGGDHPRRRAVRQRQRQRARRVPAAAAAHRRRPAQGQGPGAGHRP